MVPSISATLVVVELAVRERLGAAGRGLSRAVVRGASVVVTLIELLFVSIVLRLAELRERARGR